jgi:hypothetical protein
MLQQRGVVGERMRLRCAQQQSELGRGASNSFGVDQCGRNVLRTVGLQKVFGCKLNCKLRRKPPFAA